MSAMNEVTKEMLEQLNSNLAIEFDNVNSEMVSRSSASWAGRSSLVHLLRSVNPESPQEIERLDSILSFLSSHVRRGNGQFFDTVGKPVLDYWLGVVWVGASLGWVCGKEKLRKWSMQSTLFTDEGFEKAWCDFNPNHANPVGMGSLIKFAKAKGWHDISVKSSTVEQHTGYLLYDRATILALPPTSWCVKGIFPEVGLGALYGPSGSGKSFLAIDLACAISEGDLWFGYKTYRRPVTYVMLEGESGLKARVLAWEADKGKKLPENFKVVKQSFKLTDVGNLRELLAVLPMRGVVFIDTLNRAAPTSDENSSKEMGEILEAAKSLQHGTDGLIMLVHHTGKDQNRGARGHSSFGAALDGAIEVIRVDNKRSWSLAKVKDGGDGTSVPFRLKLHVLGRDPDGDDITSCTVEPDTERVFIPREPSGDKQRLALKAVRQALAVSNHLGVADSGATTRCLSVADAISAVAIGLTTEATNKRRSRAKALVDSLIGRGFLETGTDATGDGWVWQL
jgi:hypothetical protein